MKNGFFLTEPSFVSINKRQKFFFATIQNETLTMNSLYGLEHVVHK